MFGRLSLFYHLLSRLAYVVGVGVALKQQHRSQFFTRSKGVEAGFRQFKRLAATLMNNDAISFFFLCLITRQTTPEEVPFPIMFGLGCVLVFIGIATKVWAARRLGGGFYWHNFFFPGVPTAPDPPGPYRYLRNPMYTIGYGHMYGWALMTGSLAGLLAAAFDQTGIMLFYYIVEKPHFEWLSASQS